MLPSLGRANELARRAKCAANVRAISAALVAYAQDNDDAVPLACWQAGDRAIRRMNYAISYSYRDPSSVSAGYIVPGGHLGMLLQPENEYMDNGKDFYCPSAKDPMWQFNDPANPWWDEPGSGLVRLGYGTRPVIGWFNNGRPPWHPANLTNTLHNNGKLPRMSTPTPLQFKGQRMMVSFRSTDAMLADVTNNPKRVDRFHVEGVNVGWFDGSVHWFDRGGFSDTWTQWTGNYSDQVEDDCHYDAERDAGTGQVTVSGVWADMGG